MLGPKTKHSAIFFSFKPLRAELKEDQKIQEQLQWVIWNTDDHLNEHLSPVNQVKPQL